MTEQQTVSTYNESDLIEQYDTLLAKVFAVVQKINSIDKLRLPLKRFKIANDNFVGCEMPLSTDDLQAIQRILQIVKNNDNLTVKNVLIAEYVDVNHTSWGEARLLVVYENGGNDKFVRFLDTAKELATIINKYNKIKQDIVKARFELEVTIK